MKTKGDKKYLRQARESTKRACWYGCRFFSTFDHQLLLQLFIFHISANMCIFSACGQLVYGLLMVACLALTAVATFTSSWSEVKDLPHGPHFGIMPFACVTSSSGITCHAWWDVSILDIASNSNMSSERCYVASCCGRHDVFGFSLRNHSTGLESFHLVTFWNYLDSCDHFSFACCCKKWLIHPLSLFAILITLFLLVSVIVYGVNNHNAIPITKGTVQLGWSFWMAVGALACGAADVLVGALTVFLGRHHL